jgi:hypothetical protein
VSQVPVVRTPVTLREYIRALVRVWPEAPRAFCAVLWAQHMIETGGAACWCWNIGNVKAPAGDGDYYCLPGTWEGVAPAEAARLIAAGEAVADPSANHAHAVGPSRVSVVYQPPHPATRFRAFASLPEAMRSHIELLRKRFAKAWPFALQGDVDGFAAALHAQGYFTASPLAYALGMRPAMTEALASSAWDDARDELAAEQAADTLPELPAVGPIVHTLDLPMGRDVLDDDG